MATMRNARTGMALAEPARVSALAAIRRAVVAAWARNRPLTAVGVGMTLALLATLIGIALDPRVITGAPAWLKPAKFAISIAVYRFSLVWLLSFIDVRRRLVAGLAWGIAAAFVIEEALIALQAARGTTSHFNVATPFDEAVFRTMGAAIVVAWLLNAVVAALLLRQRMADPVLAAGLRFGLLIALVGMALAFLMVRPTPAQQAAAAAAGAMPILGAHSVGVADGGPGLPILGWSTVGGDLRVSHFVGLHALQALPLVAWLIGRFAPTGLGVARRVTLVRIAGFGYLGLTLLLAWQALRGQSLIAPDGLTLAALGALLALVGIAARAASLPAWRAPGASAIPAR